MSNLKQADIVERLRSHWGSSLTIEAADEIERLRYALAELTEWRKLKDPTVLHANLLRGFPAQLDRTTFLHLAGDGKQEA